MNPSDLLGALRRTVEQLAAFNEIAKALTSTLELNGLLELIGEKVSTLLGAERWSLLLEGDDGMLHFEICRGPGSEKLKALTVVPGEGIAGVVFTTGEARIVDDVTKDPDFAPRFDQESGAQTQAALAVPLKVRGKVLGVLELVQSQGSRAFNDDDLRAAAAVADFAAIAIDNARNFARVQELTLTDEHTGLYNARHFLDSMDRELTRCRRFARPLSVLFLDIDHFKQVNDTHGHLAGSQLLAEVGMVLRSVTRSVDTAYRYGGDEFALLLLETGADGARIVAQRVLDAFRNRTFDVKASLPISIRVSVGIASFPDHGNSTRPLIDAADRAMYRAKARGRDAFAEPDPEPG